MLQGGACGTGLRSRDDSRRTRDVASRDPAVPGARVTVAGSGEEVLSRWAGTLVMMDVRRVLGGVESARRLVATYPEAAVVMLTMAEDQEIVSHARWPASRGYLVKDATREELTATVSYALAEASWRRAPRRRRPVEMGAPPTLTERELQFRARRTMPRSGASSTSEDTGQISTLAGSSQGRGSRPSAGGCGVSLGPGALGIARGRTPTTPWPAMSHAK